MSAENESTPPSAEPSDSPPGDSGVKQNWRELPARLWAARGNPRVYGSAIGLGLLLAGSLAFALFQRDYRLAGDLEWLAGVVPLEKTDYYIEAKDPAEIYRLWQESDTGRKISATPAFEALRAGQLARVETILYLLELKAGFSFENPFAYFKETVGVAFAGEEILLVARTDLSSRAGVALVKAMATKTISMPGEELLDENGKLKKKEQPKINEDGGYNENYGGEEGSPPSFPSLVERREALNNLELTVLQSGTRKYYLVMLKEYLFVSSDLELLRSSLELATEIGSDSIGAAPGMQGARESLARRDGRVLFFVNGRGSGLAGAAAALLGGPVGFAMVLRGDEDETLSFDTFSAGQGPEEGGPLGEGWRDIASHLPGDLPLSVLVRDRSLGDLVDALAESEGAGGKTGQALVKYFKSGGAQLDELRSPGLAVGFTGFQERRKRLAPRGLIGLRGDEQALTGLHHAIFRKGGEDRREFQGVSYLIARKAGYFQPARVFLGDAAGDGAEPAPGFLATDEDSLRSVLGARKGNRPDLTDAATYDLLGDFRTAPTQLIVNVKQASEALRDFYLLGARRDQAYSEKTVQRDIDPLLAPMAAYETLHLAHGLKGPVHGRIVLSPAD